MNQNNYRGGVAPIRNGYTNADNFLIVCNKNGVKDYADELTDISKLRYDRHEELHRVENSRVRKLNRKAGK